MTSWNAIFSRNSVRYDTDSCDESDFFVSSIDLDDICVSTSTLCSVYNGNQGPYRATIDSSDTQWSISTTRISNTREEHTRKLKKKKAFSSFVKILLKIIEGKDKDKFRNVKEVIWDFEQQKERGEIDSVTESLRSPLKNAVGPRYWSEARKHLSRAILDSRSKRCRARDAAKAGPITDRRFAPHPSPIIYCTEKDKLPLHSPLPFPVMAERGTTAISNASVMKKKEMGTRKKRIWIIISVLMQRLERSNPVLYHKAHSLIKACVQRHRNGSDAGEGHRSLTRSIQHCLKNDIGVEHWRRAEHAVGKFLLRRHQRVQTGEPLGSTAFPNKRGAWSAIDATSVAATKRPRFGINH